MNKEQKQKLNQLTDRALLSWGKTGQVIKCVEECAELQQALCKNLLGIKNLVNVIEELADVEIMLHQMKRIFDVNNRVDGVVSEKLYALDILLGRA